MRRLSITAITILVAFALVASACGTSTSETATTDTSDDIARILALVPPPTDAIDTQGFPFLEIDFIDNLRRTGLWNAEAQGDTPDAEWLADRLVSLQQAGFIAPRLTPTTEMFDLDRFLLLEGSSRDAFGFDLDDVDLLAAPNNMALEDRYVVAIGAFDRSEISSTITAQPWTTEEREVNGQVFWDMGTELDVTKANEDRRDSLGRAGQLYVDDSANTVMRSSGTGVETALSIGTNNSLAEADVLLGTLTDLHDRGASTVSVFEETAAHADITLWLNALETEGPLPAAEIDSWLAQFPELPTIGYLVDGTTFSDDVDAPERITMLVASFEDGESASSGAQQLDNALSEPVDGMALTELGNVQVTADGSTVAITVSGADSDTLRLLVWGVLAQG